MSYSWLTLLYVRFIIFLTKILVIHACEVFTCNTCTTSYPFLICITLQIKIPSILSLPSLHHTLSFLPSFLPLITFGSSAPTAFSLLSTHHSLLLLHRPVFFLCPSVRSFSSRYLLDCFFLFLRVSIALLLSASSIRLDIAFSFSWTAIFSVRSIDIAILHALRTSWSHMWRTTTDSTLSVEWPIVFGSSPHRERRFCSSLSCISCTVGCQTHTIRFITYGPITIATSDQSHTSNCPTSVGSRQPPLRPFL